MLQPSEAHRLLSKSGLKGMDGPTETGVPFRWWYNEQGELCVAVWRSTTPTVYPEFIQGKMSPAAAPSLAPKESADANP